MGGTQQKLHISIVRVWAQVRHNYIESIDGERASERARRSTNKSSTFFQCKNQHKHASHQIENRTKSPALARTYGQAAARCVIYRCYTRTTFLSKANSEFFGQQLFCCRCVCVCRCMVCVCVFARVQCGSISCVYAIEVRARSQSATPTAVDCEGVKLWLRQQSRVSPYNITYTGCRRMHTVNITEQPEEKR